MTMTEQLNLAVSKVEHWVNKRNHANAMHSKWTARLEQLQAKAGKAPAKTATMLPKVEAVALVAKPAKIAPKLKPSQWSQQLIPFAAVTTKQEQAAAEFAAKQEALRDIEAEAREEADAKSAKPVKAKGKTKPAKKTKH